jgi:hypothetical protein
MNGQTRCVNTFAVTCIVVVHLVLTTLAPARSPPIQPLYSLSYAHDRTQGPESARVNKIYQISTINHTNTPRSGYRYISIKPYPDD